MEKQQISVYN